MRGSLVRKVPQREQGRAKSAPIRDQRNTTAWGRDIHRVPKREAETFTERPSVEQKVSESAHAGGRNIQKAPKRGAQAFA